ncbi:MAG: mandelate racemase/muconate lactonizing enzyme family protein [Bryobacterales bacterium]|nr:mandelate racemase/muconate lactonizing enzyme family protein [Bryobacterales bacterium]
MFRRAFLKSLAAAPAAGLIQPRRLDAALPKAKITKVNIYEPPNVNRLFNQSNMLVTVETDAGITGIGEGGSRDTLEQCAGNLIGQNPFQIERLWREMYDSWFYPPGREKIHALGAMDLALWDIKGKALNAPIHQILGGSQRNYCECYATGNVRPAAAGGARGGQGAAAGGQGGARGGGQPQADPAARIRETAAATIAYGYRVYRMDAGGITPVVDNIYNSRDRVRLVAEACRAAREGLGKSGEFMIDFHQRFDFSDALRCCKAIEEFDPFLVEDPVRDEHALQDIPKLRQMTICPLAHGEEWGQRWDFNRLVENHDIDYVRCTVPNVGGITEMMKIAAMCETHAVGIVPHFTGPVSTAALVHCLSTFSGPVLFEYNYADRGVEYLPEFLDFRAGRLYTNDRPGIGVSLDLKRVKFISSVTEVGRRQFYLRPDGSINHW